MKNHKRPSPTINRVGSLLILLCLFLTTGLFAQGVTVKFKDTPLSQVLREVEKQTPYKFVYNNSLINVNVRVSIESSKMEIAPFMEKLLTKTEISYKILDKQISLFPKEFKPTKREEQTKRELNGKVTDQDMIPLAGIYVLNQTQGKGTFTGDKGEYTIAVNDGDKVLFSMIGMVPQEVVATPGLATKNIVLQTDIKTLEDVVVTGYQTLSKERATGSFALVDNKKLGITNLASTDFAKGLAGLTAGVLVDKDGGLQIRGVSSIKSDSRPLIVVDGFPIESGNYTINPNDIESVTVLKDAAAASIWGVRASNGVVVVKTKSGGSADGKAIFNFTANLSFDQKPDFSYYQMANTSDFVDFEVETINKGWFKPAQADNTGYTRVGELFYQKHLGLIDEAGLQAGLQNIKADNSLSQQNLFYRGAARQQYNLSIQGGQKSKYYISAIYTKDLSTSIGNENEAVIINMKNIMQVLPSLTLTTGVNTTFNHAENASGYDFSFNRPYNMILDNNGNYMDMYSSVVPKHLKEGYYQNGYLSWDSNPKQELDNSNNKTNTFETRINVALDFKIAEGIVFSSKYVNELGYTHNRNLQNLNMYYPRYMANSWRVYDDYYGEYTNLFPVGPILDKTSDQFNGWTFRNTLAVDKNLGQDHSINGIIGTEIRRIANKGNSERYYNFNEKALTSDIFDQFSLSNYTPNYKGDYSTYSWNPNFYERDRRFFSLFANAAYTFKSKYTLSASARIDQSNLFGTDPKYRYQPIWSVGGNWRVSGEEFMQGVTFVDRLVARFTYGINGNIGNSSPYPIANTGKNFNTQENMLTFSNPENQELRPEKTSVTNAGIDFSLFGHKLSGSIDYYKKNSYDLLGNSILDPTTGFTRAEINTAEMTNEGLDLSLNGIILDRAVKLDATLNMGYNKNTVTKVLMPSTTATTFITGNNPVEGKPLSYMFSYRWAGLNNNGEPQVYNANGDVIGWSGSEMTDSDALDYVGSLTPPVYGGLMFNLSYKGFTLSPQFTWKLGHVLRLPVTRMDLYGGATNMISQRWQQPGDENNTDLPRVYNSSSVSAKWTRYYRNANIWEGSASYIRLSSLTLSYDIPRKFLKDVFAGAKITAQGNNLWLWANNDYDIDPEYYNLRSGSYSFPPVKNFVLSLNLIF